MPKKAINVSNFSGGLNNNTTPRDLADNELQVLSNLSNEVPGKLKVIGNESNITTTELNAINSVNYGNGLLHTNFDRNLGSPTTINETEYLFINDTTNSEVEIFDVTNTDLESDTIDYGDTSSRLEMYNIDGGVRVVPHYGNSGNTPKLFTYYKYNRKLGSGGAVGVHAVQSGDYSSTDLYIAPLRGRKDSNNSSYNYNVDTLNSHIENDGEPNFHPSQGSEVYIPSSVSIGSLGSNTNEEDRWNVTFANLEQELDDWDDFDAGFTDAYTNSGEGSMAFIPYFVNKTSENTESDILIDKNKRYGFWCSKVYKDFNGSIQESPAAYIGYAPQHANADEITQVLHFGFVGRLGQKEPNYAGFKIYWGIIEDFVEADGTYTTVEEGSVGARYLFCEVDFEEGIRLAGAESYKSFGVDEVEVQSSPLQIYERQFVYPFNFYSVGSDAYGVGEDIFSLPTVEPYIIDAPSVIGEANTGFKTSTILNRRVYAGNVQYYNDKHELVTKSDRVLKSKPNEFDYFEEESFIDVEVEDGDSIVNLSTTGNKLLQFKKQNLFIINVSRGIEFLEATFEYKGCEKEYHVIEAEGFVAWFNKYGVYIYDGNRILDIHLNDNGQPFFDDWESNYYHDNNVIGFIPKTKQLYITNNQSTNNVLMFDLKSQSWMTGDVTSTNDITNLITRNNGDINWVEIQSSDAKLVKWSNTPSSFTKTGVIMQSKEFDFGTPMVNKNINTIYVNCKQTDNIILQGFGTKRNNTPVPLTDIPDTANQSGDTLSNTTNSLKTLKIAVPDTFKNLVSFGIALKSTGAVNADFEVNDIQIVYRDKVVR